MTLSALVCRAGSRAARAPSAEASGATDCRAPGLVKETGHSAHEADRRGPTPSDDTRGIAQGNRQVPTAPKATQVTSCGSEPRYRGSNPCLPARLRSASPSFVQAGKRGVSPGRLPSPSECPAGEVCLAEARAVAGEAADAGRRRTTQQGFKPDFARLHRASSRHATPRQYLLPANASVRLGEICHSIQPPKLRNLRT